MLVVGVIAMLALARPPEDRSPHDRLDFEVKCENGIEDRLVSPGSAEYHPLGLPKYDADERYWVWVLDVDSQNGFGAMLRTQWGCVWHDSGDFIVRQGNWVNP